MSTKPHSRAKRTKTTKQTPTFTKQQVSKSQLLSVHKKKSIRKTKSKLSSNAEFIQMTSLMQQLLTTVNQSFSSCSNLFVKQQQPILESMKEEETNKSGEEEIVSMKKFKQETQNYCVQGIKNNDCDESLNNEMVCNH